MGRVTRWFKGLFGLKTASKDRRRPAAGTGGTGRETHFFHNPATIPPNITPAEAPWLSSYYPDDEDEAARNKHAIAVAAATASTADTAIAAAHAAAQVVRLTAQGTSLSKNNLLSGSCRRHNWAAVRIQSNFRAHLARKALRELKGLVKIQALVRGYLVRKQATATLHGMQALIRAQAIVRSKRAFVNTPSSTTRSESLPVSSKLELDTPKVIEVGSGHKSDNDKAARNKHAIAVAAAIASAAEAVITAVHAAAQVVRLTAQGRSLNKSNNNLLGGSCRRHNWAAVKIQSNFRAHLARKALRALKGLVKMQALVRGYLVRKQATATLRGMQALIRAQANVRSKRVFVNTPSSTTRSESLSVSSKLEHDTPKVVEVDSGHTWPGPNTTFVPVCTHHCCHGSTTAQTTPQSLPNPCPVTPTKGRPGEGNIHRGGKRSVCTTSTLATWQRRCHRVPLIRDRRGTKRGCLYVV